MADVSDKAFAFTVTSISLSPFGLNPGDVIIAEPPEILAVEDGSIVGFLDPDTGAADVGRVTGGRIMRYLPERATEMVGVAIIAVAVELQRSLRPGNRPGNGWKKLAETTTD